MKRIPSTRLYYLSIFVILSFATSIQAQKPVTIAFDQTVPQLQFAANQISESLPGGSPAPTLASFQTLGHSTEGTVILLGSLKDEAIQQIINHGGITPDSPIAPQGFAILKSEQTFWILGGDDAGTMYGGLEFAEQLKLYGFDGISDTKKDPYMKMRGSKFNIPLDVRTPSYTDVCDAAQNNIAEMWSLEFWKEYLDQMAKYRYNFISLWNLHPFPSMVKVPEYPDVALEDVMQSNGPWEENYSGQGIGFDDPSILKDLKVVKKMTIEEKIEFWKEVMAYGKSRNIDFYVVTWNIFDYGTEQKYGITDAIDNEITIDYFRKSVYQMFKTYPDLAGIGLTTGENMHGSSPEEKEDWAYKTYAEGTMDAAREQPDRNITFLHRQHQTGALDIARKFMPLAEQDNVDFLFSFKYAKAHVFSSINQPYCNDFVKEIEGMKTIWTLRNDDNYYFRWGGAGFVRDFINNIPYEVSEGFYYGSDQWIWGREFLSKSPETPRQIEVSKHWYHWLLWGRLGYDPTIEDQRFIDLLGNHFPEVDGEQLFATWQNASMIYPRTTGFHWGSLDFQWYIEGCKSRTGPAQTETGFHDVNRFITLPPHPGTDYQSIPDYVEMIKGGGNSELQSPRKVAAQLHDFADQAPKGLEELEAGGNKELRITMDDIRCMAYLGKYYALKIEGATELHLHRELKDQNSKYQQLAIEKLTEAASYWKMYAEAAQENYNNPLWTNRVGYVDWDEIYGWVLDDIKIAKATP